MLNVIVRDKNCEPIPGVSIVVKGTTRGALKSIDRKYQINLVAGDNLLLFSFVGMKTLEATIGDQRTINVTMEQENIGIEEVVAIGYGVQLKITSTGTIVTTNGEENYSNRHLLIYDIQYLKQDVPFKHLRYGEVILNYAEACIELGQNAEALTTINLIRTRAGQPNLSPSLAGDALKAAYRKELRAEMALEDHRFWDVRRWLIDPVAYKQMSRLDVRYVTSETVTRYRKADGSTWGAPIFNKADLGGDARAWNNKCYFFPIMRDEMNKNDKLIQNPGY